MSTYTIVTYFLASLGIWKILEKCGQKTRLAFVPGVRMYRLGICADREREGAILGGLEIISYGINVSYLITANESWVNGILFVGLTVVDIARLVFTIRTAAGLLRVFRMRKVWILLWIFLQWLTLLIMGFGKRFQPIDLEEKDSEELAGTNPAELHAAVDDDKSGAGLVIRVRARTVRSLSKTRYLLKDINLTIPNGSLVLLLGGSGSGKTTLINAVNGYEKADAQIRLNGKDIYRDYEEMKYRIGFVPQQELLRMNDTVGHTLDDASRLRLPKKLSGAERKVEVDGVMDILGLKDGKEGLVGKKSGGMKKRISIGTELISNPDLFILDEPDSGLDGVIARELFEKLRRIADDGKIVIAITHTPDRVVDLFDKVIVLARDSGKVGRLAFYGSPEEAYAFFGKQTMEQVIMAINPKNAGGEGRADEFIEKYAEMTEARTQKEVEDGRE